MSASTRSSWWPLGLVLCLGLGLMAWMLAKSQAPTSHTEPRAVSAAAPEHESTLPVVLPEARAEPKALVTPASSSTEAPAALADTTEPPQVERVSGRLRRLSDGSPLAGWVISVDSRRPSNIRRPDDNPMPNPHHEAVLDEHGRFELADIPPEQTAFFVAPRFRGFRDHRVVRLEWDGREVQIDRVVDTGWILEGSARSSTGYALVDAWIFEREFADPDDERELTDSFLAPRKLQDLLLDNLDQNSDEQLAARIPSSSVGISALLDANGSFRLMDVAPRPSRPHELALEVRAGFHQPVESVIMLEPSQRVITGLHFELPAAGTLEGRVLAPDGLARVIQHADLSFAWIDNAPQARDAPRFVLPAIEGFAEPRYAREPGPTVFEQELQTHAARLRHFRVPGLAPGRHLLRLHLADRPPREGDAWPGYPGLSASRSDSKADPQHEGPSHAAPRRWVEEIEVTAGELTHVDVEVPWGAAIVGHVRDRVGAPLENVFVEAFEVREWRTPADSAPVIEEVAEFDTGSLIRSLDAQGRLLTRLELRADLSRTESPGAFQLDRLPPGRLLLRVTPPDETLQPLEQWIEVTSQQTLVHDVALEHAD